MSISLNAFADMQAAQKAFIKIKNRLQWGNPPTPPEWTEFFSYARDHNCEDVTCMQTFFEQFADKSMSTAVFQTWMTLKIDELFYLKPKYIAPNSGQNAAYEANTSIRFEAFDALVNSVVSENRSWKDLFLSEKFRVRTPAPDIEPEWGIENPVAYRMGRMAPYSSSDESVAVEFHDQPNVAGVWSTNRFLTRFSDTDLNSGRKRASVFFRVMLCDEMKPSIERKNQDQLENLLAVGITEEQFAQTHKANKMINQHASRPDCRLCHQRLDPAAWTFRGVRVFLGSKPSSGALVHYDQDGQLRKQPVSSLRDLNETTIATERYKSCQVDRFIQWLIGYDALISQKRKMDFIAKFEEVDERPLDFIRYLVTTPEFFTGKTEGLVSPPSLVQARGVFQNCNECHASLPFGKNPYLARETVLKIISKLDMAHDFKNRKMPPSDHWWSPDNKDLAAIRQWVSEGAPRETGEAILNADDVRGALGGQL